MWSRAPLQLALESRFPLGVCVILAGVATLPQGARAAPGTLALLWLWPRRAACHCSDSAEPMLLGPPGGPPSSEPLGGRSLRTISSTASAGRPALSAAPHTLSA